MAVPWFETEMKRLLGQAGQRVPPQAEHRPPPQAEELIPRLCQESGRWVLVRQQHDAYWVRTSDPGRLVEIYIRCSGDAFTVLFQAYFDPRFRLDNPPSGLFGRVLLRNHDLHLSNWAMYIGESCEACLYVAAMIPKAALTASLFDKVCRELVDEINGFKRELHDKFLYDPPPPPGGHGGGGQPEVRYIEPAEPPPALPAAAEAWRIIQQQAGSVRYRLPKPGE
jgi:hypothetical protein